MDLIISKVKKNKEIIKDTALAACLAAVALIFVKPVMVTGESMLPNIKDHSYLILSRQAYTFGSPKRGDVVVFPVRKDHDKMYIKRVIGIPGDVIDIKDGKVYCNGKELDQSFTKDNFTPGSISSLRIPKGRVFVMGDNRAGSTDSRSSTVGLVNTDDISGVAVLRLWPFSEFGRIKEFKG